MEAGFPIASTGDFEAVQAVSREFPVKVAALGALHGARHRAGGAGAGQGQGAAAHPHLPRHQRHPPQVQAEEDARAGAGGRGQGGRAGAQVRRRRRVLRRGRRPHRARLPGSRSRARSSRPAPRTVNIPDTVGYSIPEEYGALIGQVAKALGDCGDRQRPLPRRSRAGGRELAGGDPERRAPGRVHRQRHRRARGQLLARGDRDGAEDARAIASPFRPASTTEQLFPASQLLTEIIGVGVAAEQGDRRRNAFAHEAGIHQDGFLKERTTYEIIDPKTVGVPESKLVLGKHSGRHALRARCEELGITSTRPSWTSSTPASSRWRTARRGSSTTRFVSSLREVAGDRYIA